MNDIIFYFFYNFSHKFIFLDNIIIFFAVYFPFIVVILAGLYLLFYRKSWREFFIVFMSSGIAYLFSKILKILIHENRPFVEFSNVQALFSMTLAFSIFILHKKAGYVFILFALLIGLARIMAGVHFPFDILGGFVLGAGISYMFAYLVKNVYNTDTLCGKR